MFSNANGRNASHQDADRYATTAQSVRWCCGGGKSVEDKIYDVIATRGEMTHLRTIEGTLDQALAYVESLGLDWDQIEVRCEGELGFKWTKRDVVS